MIWFKLKLRKIFDIIFQCIEHKIKNYNIILRLINYCIFTIILPSSAFSNVLVFFNIDYRTAGIIFCGCAAWWYALWAAAQYGIELHRRKGLKIVPVYDENNKVIGTDVVPIPKEELEASLVEIEKPVYTFHHVVPVEYYHSDYYSNDPNSYIANGAKALAMVVIAWLLKQLS